MLSREFSAREKILILIAAILALGLLYYFFDVSFFRSQMELYDTSGLETELMTEQNKAMKINQMRQIIDESQGKIKGDLSVYNNQSLEIIEMGIIFDEDADNVSLNWSDPILTGTIVRRGVTINFHCESYENFKNVLRKMSEMKYRCQIGNVILSDNDKNNEKGIEYSTNLNSSINVTFFETTEGATSLAGLTVVKDGTDPEESDLYKRAHAYD